MKCPKCSTEMDEIRKLDVVVDSCSRCGGMWLDAGELDELRAAARDSRIAEQGNRSSQRADDAELIGQPTHTNHHAHKHPKRKHKKSLFDVFEIFD